MSRKRPTDIRTATKSPSAGPTVVDLFCGAGGLSAGFAAAGYSVVGGIDNWAAACESFAANEPGAAVRCGDIREIDADEYAAAIGRQVDLVLGGPSCQGFSTSSGLSRNGRQRHDPRNSLFIEFVRFVTALKPYWIIMENVPGLLLYDRGAVGKAVLEEFQRIGYSVIPMILLAADFGVPQLRRRVFFIGNRTGQPISFPSPTHGDPELWKDFALPFAHLSRIGNKNAHSQVKAHVSIADACSDLPMILEGQSCEERRYPMPAQTSYQRRIRRCSRRLTLHRASVLSPSDRECIPLIPQGGNWRSLPEDIRERRFHRIRAYDATTMLRRPLWNKPAYTITTKSNDATAGAFIHPLSDRTLSLREAARLQSFPDRYELRGSDSQIREQIGNAVPPLLAEMIAKAVAPEIWEASACGAPRARVTDRVTFECVTDWDDVLGLGRRNLEDPRQLTLFA